MYTNMNFVYYVLATYVFGTETVLQCHRNSVNKSPHILLITTHNSAFTHINNYQ